MSIWLKLSQQRFTYKITIGDYRQDLTIKQQFKRKNTETGWTFIQILPKDKLKSSPTFDTEIVIVTAAYTVTHFSITFTVYLHDR